MNQSMQCRVFYTDVKLPQGVTQPNFSQLMPIICETGELATERAIDLITRGAVMWKIEGPNGLLVDRSAVEKEYARRTGKHAGT